MGAVLGRTVELEELCTWFSSASSGGLSPALLACQFLASPSSPIALSKAALASLGFWSGLHPFLLSSIYPFLCMARPPGVVPQDWPVCQ